MFGTDVESVPSITWHQEGKHAEQAGQTNRRASGDTQKNERGRAGNKGKAK